MFDRIAPRYDLLNRLLSAGTDVRWRRRCVDALALADGAMVLDLCTGTADLLIECLARGRALAGRRHRPVERDAAAWRTRSCGRRASRVARRCSLGDAERLPLRPGLFDGAVVAFGIRNVGEIDAALREVLRVLRPGGRFVILEFSIPRGVLGRLYRFYFTRVLPVLGGLVSGNRGAYAYLPASVERFDSPPGACRSGSSAPASHGVSVRPLSGGIAHLHLAEKPGVSRPRRGTPEGVRAARSATRGVCSSPGRERRG